MWAPWQTLCLRLRLRLRTVSVSVSVSVLGPSPSPSPSPSPPLDTSPTNTGPMSLSTHPWPHYSVAAEQEVPPPPLQMEFTLTFIGWFIRSPITVKETSRVTKLARFILSSDGEFVKLQVHLMTLWEWVLFVVNQNAVHYVVAYYYSDWKRGWSTSDQWF